MNTNIGIVNPFSDIKYSEVFEVVYEVLGSWVVSLFNSSEKISKPPEAVYKEKYEFKISEFDNLIVNPLLFILSGC